MGPTDEQLYDDLCSGDAAAFDAFYARFAKRLHGFIVGYVKTREDAEDVFHDVFQAVIQASRSGAEPPRAVASWLFTVARNRCLNHRRAQRPSLRSVEELAAGAASAEDELAAAGRTAALGRSVARLPPRLGEVYRLRASGLSYEDMASELGVPLGTVKSRVHTLIRRLQKDMRAWLVK